MAPARILRVLAATRACGSTVSARDNDGPSSAIYERPLLSEHVSTETVVRLVREVSTRYAEELLKERRAAGPDPARLQMLQERLVECAADEEALQDADQEQVAAIEARYAALAQELKGQ